MSFPSVGSLSPPSAVDTAPAARTGARRGPHFPTVPVGVALAAPIPAPAGGDTPFSESQRLALDLLARYSTVTVSNITHTGYAGREGVYSPGIAAPTAKWLVEHGYATRWRSARGKLVQDEWGPYLQATR